MEQVNRSLLAVARDFWRNKWGRRFTGVALIYLALELLAALAVLGGYLWMR